MNRSRLRAVLIKEWREARRNRGVVWTTLVVAVLMVTLPFALIYLLPAAELDELARDAEATIALMVERLPDFAALDPGDQVRAYLLRQLVMLFTILPVVSTMTIATYSIVGEKRGRSLEPLLATPVTTGELLVGKSLAAVLPSVAVTWVAWLGFGLMVRSRFGGALTTVVLDLAAWLTILLVVPLIAVLAVASGILVSSRSSDPRSAQQIGSLILLPVLALLMGQLTGFFLLGPMFVTVGAAVLLAVDVALLAWGRRLFQREQILVRWR